MRLTYLLLVAVFGLPGSPRGAAEPPSSLEPDARGSRIVLAHHHRRTTSCYAHEEKGKKAVCRAKREDATAATKVRLLPVAGARSKVTRNDPRTPVEATFPDEAGSRQVEVELLEGTWEVEWEGQRVRMVVGHQSPFTVSLRTVSGQCAQEGQRCSLRSDAIERTVSVPEANRPRT